MQETFDTLTTLLSNMRPQLQEVYVSPCTASKDTFSVCAVIGAVGNQKAHFFEESCLSGCYRGDVEVDLEEELEKLRKKYSVLYTNFGARNVQDIADTVEVQASIMTGRNSAVTASVYFLPKGRVLSFSPNKFFGTAQALLLQRTSFRGAKTFDAELLDGDNTAALELRLVKNCHLTNLQNWGTNNNMVVFRSSEIVSSKLLLRAYRESVDDGKTPYDAWVLIARALTGEEDDSENEDGVASEEDEWIPDSDESDSDESMDSDDEYEEDLLDCLRN